MLRITLAFVIAHSSAETTYPAAQVPACFEAKEALANEKDALTKISLHRACAVACVGIDGACGDDHHDDDPFHPGQYGNMNQNPFVVADLGCKPSKN